jgi:membrane-associated HD superfamily phosphohydrolase
VELIERILDSVDASGGGWPVLVLVLVLGAIVYLARYVLSRQIRISEQHVAERKVEFEAQLQRERDNAHNYQDTTKRMVDAFDKNSAAIAEFSGILRPMSDTLARIDRHLDNAAGTSSTPYRQRNKPKADE